MSVRKVKLKNRDGSYRQRWAVDVQYITPEGKEVRVRRIATVQTKRGAEAEELQVRMALVNRTYKRKEERKEIPTLEAFQNDFIICYAEANNKSSEVDTKKSILKNHLIPYFGKKKLDAISAMDVQRFIAQKAKVYKPATVNNILTVLRKALSKAVEWDIIESVPMFEQLKVPPPAFDFLEFEELEKLVPAAEKDWEPLITVAANTGMRTGELLALKWKNVDFGRRLVTITESIVRGRISTPKNGKSRVVELNALALNALQRQRHLKGEFVFCDEKGNPLTKNKLKWPLWRACDKAGLRRIRAHVLRHTFASHLAMRGRTIHEIKELMGHASIKTTERYMHLSPHYRRDAVESLETSGNTTATRGSELCNNAE